MSIDPGSSAIRSARPDPLRGAFIAVTALFFTWGFITSMIDPLIPAVRAIFSLNYTESLLTQFAFFLAYGIMSLPGGMILARFGYASSIAGALLAMTAGCVIVALASQLATYTLVLTGLFVLGAGMTVLQVAANPLSASLGDPQRSHFRGSSGSIRQGIAARREPDGLPLFGAPRRAESGRPTSREKKGGGNLPEGRSPRKGAPVQAFFILARETNPFLSRKYMYPSWRVIFSVPTRPLRPVLFSLVGVFHRYPSLPR